MVAGLYFGVSCLANTPSFKYTGIPFIPLVVLGTLFDRLWTWCK